MRPALIYIIFLLAKKYLFGILNLLEFMADIVKWLRPRIVVPICVGSNPTIRPIIRIRSFGSFFIRNDKGFQGSNEILKTYYPIMEFELFKVVVYIQDNCNLLSGLIITDGAII